VAHGRNHLRERRQQVKRLQESTRNERLLDIYTRKTLDETDGPSDLQANSFSSRPMLSDGAISIDPRL
jgi:hypothetical protein